MTDSNLRAIEALKLVKSALSKIDLDEIYDLYSFALSHHSAGDPDDLIDTREAARISCRSPNTLKVYRANGTGNGPDFFKRDGKVLYRRGDVLEWAKGDGRRKTTGVKMTGEAA